MAGCRNARAGWGARKAKAVGLTFAKLIRCRTQRVFLLLAPDDRASLNDIFGRFIHCVQSKKVVTAEQKSLVNGLPGRAGLGLLQGFTVAALFGVDGQPCMNMRFLLTFVWVARLGSFRLTAEKLSSTQAAISSRISVLEAELGVQLFQRDSRGVSLTREGHNVLSYAQEMLATQQRLLQSLGQADTFSGRLRIGVMDTVIHSWLSELINALSREYPQVEVELTADTALNLNEQLLKGQLDLIFQTDLLRANGVRNRHLACYPLRWVVASGTPLDRPYEGLAALCQERILTFSRLSRPHQDVLNYLHQQGVSAPRISCINSVAAIIKLVADGFGIGVLPPVLVSRELSNGSLVELPMCAGPGFSVYASWRVGAGLELNEAVVSLAQEVVADYQRAVAPGHLVLPKALD
mgnify:FL=1